jgi:lipopolysaccharide export system protein LptC
MYGRSTIVFPLALLVLLALLTLWIDRSVQPPEHKVDGNTRHDPDYIMHNFVTTKTDVNGKLQYVLAAVEMTHYPDNDSTELVRPRFTQYATDKPYTQIEGQRGTISGNGDVVEFIGNVKVVRQEFQDRGEMTMSTQYLRLFPKEEVATTDKPVVITQAPKTVIHANGMVFDKKKKTIDLSGKVRVHYEKPVTPTATKPAATRTTKAQAKPVTTNKTVPAKNSKKPNTPGARKTSFNQTYRFSETS